ncbi:acyltransferase family protein [Phenylobacterium sp.]|uniref:acyltransferase family protein n=1 Tax=Phenylobacterium sp. TaxID=1871053 RepID=UPI00356695D4
MWASPLFQPFKPVRRDGATIRFHELDGLRGWAALSVVVFHFYWETFGVVMPGLRNLASAFFLDGSLAVSLFFVLSGEALSAGYFAGKGEAAVVRLAVKRYTRLTIPIAATCLIVLALSRLQLVHNAEAARIVHREDWLGTFLQVPQSAGDYVRYALLGVYGDADPRAAVDPFLWTMRYEMAGSVLVFIVLLAFRRLWAPWLILLGLALLLTAHPGRAYLACFLFGIAFSAARASGVFARIQDARGSGLLSGGALIVLGGLDGWANLSGFAANPVLFTVPILFAVSCNRRLCDALSSRPSRFLGRLSFPIYLMQFPVLVSFTSGAIVYAQARGGLTTAGVWIIATLSLSLCLLAAVAFLPVETLERWVGERLIGLLPARARALP